MGDAETYRKATLALLNETAEFFQPHADAMIGIVCELGERTISFKRYGHYAEDVKLQFQAELSSLTAYMNRHFPIYNTVISGPGFEEVSQNTTPKNIVIRLAQIAGSEDLVGNALPKGSRGLHEFSIGKTIAHDVLQTDWRALRFINASFRGALVEEIAADLERARSDPTTAMNLAKGATERIILAFDLYRDSLPSALRPV